MPRKLYLCPPGNKKILRNLIQITSGRSLTSAESVHCGMGMMFNTIPLTGDWTDVLINAMLTGKNKYFSQI